MEENKNVNEELENKDNPAEQDTATEQEDKQPTLEEVMAELARERAEKEKMKVASDKYSSEIATLKKQLRAKQTAEEAAEDAKREQEEAHKEYVAGLEKKLALIEAKARYADMGMDPELAAKTAEAELDGDKETVSANIKKMMAASLKSAEAEWLKSRPDAQAGADEDPNAEDPFIKGFTGK
ncbi:MAG TPA: hypothetical protein IAB84_06830 [Candidatus Choladousia intestinigallinarum]|nr:hypothetical protein [Candidatus Choladousia intestinigallinarum]